MNLFNFLSHHVNEMIKLKLSEKIASKRALIMAVEVRERHYMHMWTVKLCQMPIFLSHLDGFSFFPSRMFSKSLKCRSCEDWLRCHSCVFSSSSALSKHKSQFCLSLEANVQMFVEDIRKRIFSIWMAKKIVTIFISNFFDFLYVERLNVSIDLLSHFFLSV